MLDNNCKCFYEPEDDIVRPSRRPSLGHGTYYKVDSSTTHTGLFPEKDDDDDDDDDE